MMTRYFQLRSKRDPDSGAFNRDHHDDQLVKLQETVFLSPVILEVILMHGLQQNGNSRDGRLCTREARRLRLVSKAWLLQINSLFQKRRESLVCLDCKNLKQFLEMCDTRNLGIPPTSLSIGLKKALFSPDFCEDLSKLFGKDYLVAKLTVLRISDPRTIKGELLEQQIHDGVIGLPNFPSHFKLTNLRKIMLKQLCLSRDIPEDERVRIPRMEEFIHQVMDQSENLEVFQFEGEAWWDCLPGQYEGLTLRRTVTRMELDTRMNLTKILGIKDGGWRALEGITTLKLNVTTRNLFGSGELEGILEGVRMSLEQLELDFRYDPRMNDIEVVLRVPVMEGLKRLRIGGNEWRVERSQVLNGLGERFPQLEKVEFYNYLDDELILNDWCGDNSVFESVLSVKMVPEGGGLRVIEMSEDKMRRILKAFPNVEKLWMEPLNVGDMEGVRYMFGELGGKLRSLHLDFRGYLDREEEMEGIFIGGDVEMVKRLKGKSGGKLWEEFLEGGGNEGYRSLRDLVNLEELEMVGYSMKIFQNDWFWRLVRRPNMLSYRFGCEVLFEGAFMRMPKLRRLVLKGGLRPAEGMVEKWRRQGGGNERVAEFRRAEGFWDWLWEIGSWRWYILWVVCWALVIFWDGGQVVRGADEPKNKIEEEEKMMEIYLTRHFDN